MGVKDLRYRRETLFLSRPELSRASGVSVSSIAKFEVGFRPVRSPALKKVEATLAAFEQQVTEAA